MLLRFFSLSNIYIEPQKEDSVKEKVCIFIAFFEKRII